MEQKCPQEIQTCMGQVPEEQSQPPADTKESQTTSGQ
jgi:hypothetical protein